MNLFDEKLAEFTTPDNAVYLEAVSHMYKVLFEEQIDNAQEQSTEEPAAEDTKQQPDAEVRQHLLDIAQKVYDAGERLKNEKDMRDNSKPSLISYFVKPATEDPIYDSADQTKQNQYDTWSLFKHCLETPTMSNYDLFKNLYNIAARLIQNTKIVNDKTWQQNLRIGKVPNAQIQSALNFRDNLLSEFTQYLVSLANDHSRAPSMFKRPAKDKNVYLGNDFFNTTTNTTDAADTAAATPNGKAPKTGKKTTKEEKSAAQEDEVPTNFIDGSSVSADANHLIISAENMPPQDANRIINYLNNSLNELLQSKGKALSLRRESFVFEYQQGTGTGAGSDAVSEDDLLNDTGSSNGTLKLYIDQKYTDDQTNMNLYNISEVALYCLYMDARIKDIIAAPMKVDGASIIVQDNYNGRGFINKLAKHYEISVYDKVNLPGVSEIAGMLNMPATSGLAQQIAAAIYSYISDTFNPKLIAQFNGANEEELRQYKTIFNKAIANVVDIMNHKGSNTEDKLRGKVSNAGGIDKGKVLGIVGNSDVFTKLLADIQANSAKDSDPSANAIQDYNTLAANVITYCRNDNQNKRMENHNEYRAFVNDDFTRDEDDIANEEFQQSDNQSKLAGFASAR
jgi:hypothetical protein